MCDVADPHFALIGERNGDNVLSIQVFVDHAAAHGISVQADQKVEQRGTVAHADVFLPLRCRKDFLRKVERIVLTLLKREVRIFFEFFVGDHRLLCQRMISADENVRPCDKQKMKFQLKASSAPFR